MYCIINAATTGSAATTECSDNQQKAGPMIVHHVAANIFRQQQRACRKSRHDVPRQLRGGKGKEHDRDDEPDHEKHRQSIFRVEHLSFFRPPGANTLYQRDADKHGPGHEAEQSDRDVVPEGLGVVIEVLAKSLQVVFKDEYAKKFRIPELNRDVPRKCGQRRTARFRGASMFWQ